MIVLFTFLLGVFLLLVEPSTSLAWAAILNFTGWGLITGSVVWVLVDAMLFVSEMRETVREIHWDVRVLRRAQESASLRDELHRRRMLTTADD